MKKYAIVGAGSRGTSMYAIPIAKGYGHVAELAGVYDINKKRAQLLRDMTGLSFPVYDSFSEMLEKAKPDVVIVTTVDRYHHEYIIQSLEAGCDVITEKPMTIDAGKCNDIVAAEKRTGKKVTVTFNCRFAPFFVRIKELLKEGVIGKVLSVHYEWFLDTKHGADYFRRWHRRKENSGGLLVHKSTHHFDLANWYLEEEPEIVNAFGTRRFYGPTREKRGERCLTCAYKGECEFFLDISKDDSLRKLYLECESEDGYYRDRCVFADEIDIEDSVSINVKYSGGAVMSYSLTAHSPYEGLKIVLNGTEGRLEADNFSGQAGPYSGTEIRRVRLYNRKNEEISYTIPKAGGEHGGGDARLIKMLIEGNLPDPLGKMADSRAGAMSVIIGAAANESMKQGKSIRVTDLLKL